MTLPHDGKIVPHPDPSESGWVVMQAVPIASGQDYFYEDLEAYDSLTDAQRDYPTFEVMAYAGIVQYLDGSRSIDWCVRDPVNYQAMVDVLHITRPVTQAFLVPPQFRNKHDIDWGSISVSDLDKAGCGGMVLYPRGTNPTESVGAAAPSSPPRSARPETRNPLLALPAFQALRLLPPDSRQRLREALLELSRHAGRRAEKCWRKSKAPMAVYWKGVAVYARHASHLLR